MYKQINTSSTDVLNLLKAHQITEDDIVNKIRDLQNADAVFVEDVQELLNKIVRENMLDLDTEIHNRIKK